jgi:hypothetical protein
MLKDSPMQIVGIDGMTHEQLRSELQNGGKFVFYEYCISIIILTFKRPTHIYYIKPGKSAVSRGLGYSAMTLCTGWWGIPFGPIFTIMALATNLSGGKDVTREVVASLR